MSTQAADQQLLFDLIKKAVAEVLDERRDWLEAVVAEAVEDMALVAAIRDGESSDSVSRSEVFARLGS